jgi:hypothetical protein
MIKLMRLTIYVLIAEEAFDFTPVLEGFIPIYYTTENVLRTLIMNSKVSLWIH